MIQTWFKLDSTWFKGDIGGITRDWNSIKCAIQSWLKLNLTWLKTWFKLDSNLISDSIVIQTLFKRDTGPSGEEIVIQTWFGRNSCNFKTKRQLIVISRGLELETSFRLVLWLFVFVINIFFVQIFSRFFFSVMLIIFSYTSSKMEDKLHHFQYKHPKPFHWSTMHNICWGKN